MAMSDPRELFLHELGDALYAERQILKALPKLAQEAGDGELRESLVLHEEETQEHIINLEQAFVLLGEKAKPEKCHGIEGIIKEYKNLAQEKTMARGAERVGKQLAAAGAV